MKGVIGRVVAYKASQRNAIRFYFVKQLHKQIGKEIVFNEREMTFTLPDIDSPKTWVIRSSMFLVTPKLYDIDHYLGEYLVLKKDEDTFKLTKIKNDK